MSDVDTQTGGTPRVQPFTRADAVLIAWSRVCELEIESLATQGESAKERAMPGIAVHLLRNDNSMSAEDVAQKLGVPTTYVRLLTIETARALASQRVHGVPIRAKMARVREIAKEMLRAENKRIGAELKARRETSPRPEPEREPKPEHVPKVKPAGRRTGRRKSVSTPVDEVAGMEVVGKVAPLFRASVAAIRGPNMSRIREASWARMTVMSLLHCVITPKAAISAIARFFGVSGGSVCNAIGTVEQAANWKGTHMYKHAIIEACRLYGVRPSALKRHTGKEVTAL